MAKYFYKHGTEGNLSAILNEKDSNIFNKGVITGGELTPHATLCKVVLGAFTAINSQGMVVVMEDITELLVTVGVKYNICCKIRYKERSVPEMTFHAFTDFQYALEPESDLLIRFGTITASATPPIQNDISTLYTVRDMSSCKIPSTVGISEDYVFRPVKTYRKYIPLANFVLEADCTRSLNSVIPTSSAFIQFSAVLGVAWVDIDLPVGVTVTEVIAGVRLGGVNPFAVAFLRRPYADPPPAAGNFEWTLVANDTVPDTSWGGVTNMTEVIDDTSQYRVYIASGNINDVCSGVYLTLSVESVQY